MHFESSMSPCSIILGKSGWQTIGLDKERIEIFVVSKIFCLSVLFIIRDISVSDINLFFFIKFWFFIDIEKDINIKHNNILCIL